jgi:ubiquinone/menaquinone biosynthesis C-methylase UbiE
MTSNGSAGQARYISDEVLDARYFKALDRFDIRFSRTMWVYDNLRAGSDVLHLGCGAGMLALLKRKGITLTGVDTSPECAMTARRNGYDATYCTELTRLPFPDASFDYVVSLDGLSQLSNAEQERALPEMKRVLRPGGVSLHVIECDDARKDTEYAGRFVEIFQHVAFEPRYALCAGAEDFLDQTESDVSLEADLLEYVRGLSFKERRAFDIAMGYVFNKVSDLGVAEPNRGQYIFLKASDEPLGPFYNEHRDRGALFSSNWTGAIDGGLCLDRGSDAVFDDGWYAPAMLPPIARWMGRHGRIRFRSLGIRAISLDLSTQLPDLHAKPLGLELLLNGLRLSAFSLYKYGWLEVPILVPESLTAPSSDEFELEIRADRAAQLNDEEDREISIAVCNIEIRGQNRLR